MTSHSFTELELDALMEIFNVGFGYAADSLSKMVNDQVTLSVPGIRIVNQEEADREFQQSAAINFCGVIQRFEGDFQANAVLMFPGDKSLELVRLMVGEMVALEDMNDLEQEALTEVGNILLNSCVSAMADAVGGHFRSSMPEFISGYWCSIYPNYRAEADQILLLNIDFKLERREIHGYLMFIMQLKSIEHFKTAIMKYMNRFS
jgi:chemotaxis protein CheC